MKQKLIKYIYIFYNTLLFLHNNGFIFYFYKCFIRDIIV